MTDMMIKLSEEFEGMKKFDISIMMDGAKIGYAELYVAYDEDGDEAEAYVKDIAVNEEYRNRGIGTEILKALAEEHNGIYICPDNEDAERLYARLGEETTSSKYFYSELDNWDSMYFIQ